MANRGKIVSPTSKRARERWVHDDQCRALDRGEGGVERRTVVAGNARGREDIHKAATARGIELIEVERQMGAKLRDQKAISSARLQDHVVWLNVRQEHRNGSDINRSRELLPLDLLFAADGLSREACHQADDRADIVERGEGQV